MPFDEGHALVVGVGSYADPKWSAPITVGDATSVAAALTDEAVAGYPANQVSVLRDAAADRAGVTKALTQLADRAGPGDVVLIFFAGHGVPGDDGLYTLATHDTRFSPGGKAEQGTGLSEPELLDALRAIKAEKLLFLVNACLSGNIHATLGARAVPTTRAAGARALGAEEPEAATLGAMPTTTLNARVLATGEGRVVITAARATQSSYFSPAAATTVFGQALVDGLRGKAGGGGGYVGVYDLYGYLYTAVKDGAAAIGGDQEPVLNVAEGVGPFPVALHAAPAGAGARPRSLGVEAMLQSPPAGTAVRTYSDDVLSALRPTTVHVDASRSLINFGGAHVGGSITVGNVAGGDMITVNSSAAAAVDDRAALLARIDEVRSDVAALDQAPAGLRDDAADDLRKAREAAEGGDVSRAVEKLDSAQAALLRIGATVPKGVALSEAVGVLLQRARTHA